MDQTLDNKPVPSSPLDPKELDFFVERLAQILLMQIEHENKYEHEEKTRRLPKAI
jgi:hypothetical protein